MNFRFLLFALLIFQFLSCAEWDDNSLVTKNINHGWEFRQKGTDTWIPANVPGTVHTDLLENGLIDDPFYRLNEKQLQWIDKTDWEYRTVFEAGSKFVSSEKVELVFEGLDTYAQVYLNGELILEADNMFRPWLIDVKDQIITGKNELKVILESPTRKGLEKLKKFGFQLAADNDQSENGEMGADRVSPYVRKAPYHFGWDWGPRLVTSGIWRPVQLRAWSLGKVDDIRIVSDFLSEEKAELTANVEIITDDQQEFMVNIYVDGISVFSGTRNLEPGTRNIEIPFTIADPVLWWPNGMGDQKLYAIKAELVVADEIIDTKTTSMGLRTVKLVQEPDPDGQGKSFYFEVNGKPVFAKGANYIPNDVFLNRVGPEKYEFIIKSAADANMNMLRVWGGGIYEDDLFYDLCDKYGIMVWQDFMFACAMYPGNDEFLESVRLEAVANVKRLRNHPSVVLWCGNNEIEAAWGPYEENRGWGWKQRYNAEQREIMWKAYDTLFHKILPEVIKQEDPGRSYWHSSPSAGISKLASYESTSGDMHYWGVWHGLHPFRDFRKYKARFTSEYGFQSFPEYNSVKKYTLPQDCNIESEVMMSHQRSGIGNLRIRQYMEEDYIIPVDFEQLLYVGQILQAEAIKTAIESHRAEMPYCMGSLYWQINDCWPVASWSGIDYYGKWKALHYFAREAFKPVVIVVAEKEGMLEIKIVSDNETGSNLKLEMKLLDFDGEILWESAQDAGTPSHFTAFSIKEILRKADPAAVVMVSELTRDNEILDTDKHYFVKPKDMKLKAPQITSAINDKGDRIEILLTAGSLAKNVFLHADGFDDQFPDNYFDILPGETVSMAVPVTENSVETLKSLKVLSLYSIADETDLKR